MFWSQKRANREFDPRFAVTGFGTPFTGSLKHEVLKGANLGRRRITRTGIAYPEAIHKVLGLYLADFEFRVRFWLFRK